MRVTPFVHSEELVETLYQLSCVKDDLYKWMPYTIDHKSSFEEHLNMWINQRKWEVYIIYDDDDKVAGMVCYLNINDQFKTIEIGGIWVATEFQGKGLATRATLLLLNQAFERGYRRVEWKTHHLNIASQKTALKIGFKYEGTFRNHMFYKNQSRDTLWYSIIDSEWPLMSSQLNTIDLIK
jgi:RimJ/RimL family protein N-acetyltransferase